MITMRRTDIRNIAIIAHVDHGNTTLVDAILKQTHVHRNIESMGERILDSMDQERERGITIKAKNASVLYNGVKINIVDTPGHADFGGEVERTLRLADGVLLLVEAKEGPMPQPTFVLRKALSLGHKATVVINKVHRPVAQIEGVAKRTDGTQVLGRATDVLIFEGLERKEVDSVEAGEIVAVAGFDEIGIGETLADAERPMALPPVAIDQPTVEVTFSVNTSPFAGREGKYLTSRHLRDRLYKELETNVSLRVDETDSADSFLVAGRGELHLAVFIETMRREGYELQVSQPKVILREEDGVTLEPYEELMIEVPVEYQGAVIEEVGPRRGVLRHMKLTAHDNLHLEYHIPTRGVIGLKSLLLTKTKGTVILNHIFQGYEK